MVLAEIFLTAFIQVLVEKLASGDLWSFARRERIDTRLTKLSRMLGQINAVLADAEEKQMTDRRGIKVWLEELEDLAYDLDDILDEFSIEALRRQVRASTSKVRALLPTCCTSFNPNTLVSDFRMSPKIDGITTRLRDLLDRTMELGLVEMVAAGPSARAPQRPPTAPLIHEPCLYGREEDKKAIIELLRGDQSSSSKVGVVPIVGMGGLGKTTLAQMVYNDELVVKHFDVKAWVCVSEEFDIMGVTKAILEYITTEPCKFQALGQVQVELQKALAGKKFLIVLDDVWNKNHKNWSSLKSPFSDGAQGSKVVVTTRDTNVAFMVETVEHYCLKQLSEDDCWSVFAQHAFENTSTYANPNLVSIGRKIAAKCGGLPLAARTLGGLLKGKRSDKEWEDVLNSKMWDLLDEESDILPALRLSYYHLPSPLKKCFAYCSVLPKDYEFEEKELVLWWMAEGCIQQPTGQKQLEDLGGEYFRELQSRSFFQLSSSGEVSLFVMHDLINDLAQFVARKNCFRLEDKKKDNEWERNITKARHLSYMRGYCDGIKKFEGFRKAKNLRTFLPYGSRNQPNSYLTSYVPLDLLPNLRRLRLLSLRSYRISELSSSIGDLKHLRYLDLSYALIVELPESVSTLCNLQTLTLRYCEELKKLPTNTGNLINLRHLDITGADSLQEMPPKMDKLTNLQTLSNFIVGKGKGSTIRELGNLIHLRGTLCISGLENVENPLDAKGAKLNEKQGLDALFLKWSNSSYDSDDSDDSRNASVESEVLDMLQPHKKLKELTISGYDGLSIPTWVGNCLFSDMVSLKFQTWGKCISLPPLGKLPSLSKLYIQGMKAVKDVGAEFYGNGCSNPFPSLKILTFKDMPEWEEWSALPFGRMSELSIKRCPKLFRQLPNNLPCLRKLKIEDCPLLVVDWAPNPPVHNEVRNTLCFDSLISLSLENISIPDSSLGTEVGDEAVPENTWSSHLGLLTSMRVENIMGLTCLPNWFFQELTGLQELTIHACKEITALWKNEVQIQRCLPSLRRLVVGDCPLLVSLFGEEEEEGQQQQRHEGLPCTTTLEYLEIRDCGKLEHLPQGLHTLTSLQELSIYKCPCLISFPKTGLPSSLRTLRIQSCDALLSPPELMILNNLEKLVVCNCPSLTYLSSSKTGLPLALKELDIKFCRKLESLLEEEGMEINCPSLETIKIWSCKSLHSLPDVMQNNDLWSLKRLVIGGCDNLESIPEGWLPAANLSELKISDCKKLQDLPQHADIDNNLLFASLQDLRVLRGCRAATRIVSYLPKEGSYFTNLTELYLDNVDLDKPPSEWGLHRLSSLRKLDLEGYNWVSFPEEDGMLSLPFSLMKLGIFNFPNLEKLSCKGFQNLTSLKQLHINGGPMLTSVSELGLLPSLSELLIFCCPNLASLAVKQGGLPPSLLCLGIRSSPILEQRCEKGKGQYWPFVARIPNVSMTPDTDISDENSDNSSVLTSGCTLILCKPISH